LSLLTATEIAMVAAHVQVFLKNFTKGGNDKTAHSSCDALKHKSFPNHKKSPEQPHRARPCQVPLRDALFVVN